MGKQSSCDVFDSVPGFGKRARPYLVRELQRVRQGDEVPEPAPGRGVRGVGLLLRKFPTGNTHDLVRHDLFAERRTRGAAHLRIRDRYLQPGFAARAWRFHDFA